MMMHVALGWKFRDLKVRQGAVVYCALEGCAAFKNRVAAFRQAKMAKDISGVPFHLMASPMSLVTDHPALIASIWEQATRPCAVVIDTLNRSLQDQKATTRICPPMSKLLTQSGMLLDASSLSFTIAAMKEHALADIVRLWAPSTCR